MKRRKTAALVVGLLAAGIGLRIALQFPLHRFAPEADCTTIAFGAWEILTGDLRIFIATGYRQGALPCYLTVAASWFVGPGRAALTLAVLAVGVLQMFVWWGALLELTGWRARDAGSARLLAFIVLPSSAMVCWGIAWPNGYPDLTLAATLVLWSGARFWRRGGYGELFAFGLACGFAFWLSMVTLGIVFAVAAWLVWQRRRTVLTGRALSVAATGAVLGAMPWLAFNLRYDWVSLKSNWAVRPVNDGASFLRNVRRLFGEVLPTLFESISQEGPIAPRFVGHLSGWIALGLAAVAVGAIARALHRRRVVEVPAGESATDLPAHFALTVGVVTTTALLFVFSAAAAVPGNIVRYVLPLFLVWPLVVALAWEVSGRMARRALATLSVALLATYAIAVPWPWTAARVAARVALDVEHQMLAQLEARGVEAVFGSFWEAYPLIFESGGALGGSTLEPGLDFHDFAAQLPAGPCRWALVGRYSRLKEFASTTGESGRLTFYTGGLGLFVAGVSATESGAAPSCASTLERLRQALG